jgi:UDP-glucuronate decarboxylase
MNKIVSEDISKIISSDKVDWNSLFNKSILITGASGFLPSYMIETLLALNKAYEANIQITALVRNEKNYINRFSHHLGNPNLKLLLQDVSKPIQLDSPHHFIIHAASQASPKYYGLDPVGTLQANVLGTINVLELARNHPIESLLYFSSGEVYGEANTFPTKESDYGYLDPVSVRSCYAESKRMAENMCSSWHSQFNIPAKIVRPFHTYGPGISLNDGRVYADFIKNVLYDRKIILKSEGESKRAFCYLSDATLAFFIVLTKGENAQPYNVGNKFAEITISNLANLLVEIFPEKNLNVIKKIDKPTSEYLQSPISRNLPDTSKIELLGWAPEIALKDGFIRTVSSFS